MNPALHHMVNDILGVPKMLIDRTKTTGNSSFLRSSVTTVLMRNRDDWISVKDIAIIIGHPINSTGTAIGMYMSRNQIPNLQTMRIKNKRLYRISTLPIGELKDETAAI